MGGRGLRTREDRGSVTVEAALALCALVVVLAMALGGVLAVTAQLRCTDAAREAARLTARGDSARGREAAARLAPGGAAVDVALNGDEVRVRVSVAAAGGLLPGLRIGAEAVGVLEPGQLEPGQLEPGQLEPGQLEPGNEAAGEPHHGPGEREPGRPGGPP